MSIGGIDMSTFHHTPGRVRFKFAGLQNQKHLASVVQQAIRRLDSVKLVQVNTTTGSLLVHYDVRGERESALLSAIHDISLQFGLGSSPIISTSANTTRSDTQHKQVDILIDTLLGKALEKVMERAALALVAALI
jgi:hypothetical protein